MVTALIAFCEGGETPVKCRSLKASCGQRVLTRYVWGMGKERKGLCKNRGCSGLWWQATVAAVWGMWKEEWPEMKLDTGCLVEILNVML